MTSSSQCLCPTRQICKMLARETLLNRWAHLSPNHQQLGVSSNSGAFYFRGCSFAFLFSYHTKKRRISKKSGPRRRQKRPLQPPSAPSHRSASLWPCGSPRPHPPEKERRGGSVGGKRDGSSPTHFGLVLPFTGPQSGSCGNYFHSGASSSLKRKTS